MKNFLIILFSIIPIYNLFPNDNCIPQLKKFKGTWSNGKNFICICNMYPVQFTDECNKEETIYQSLDENSIIKKGDGIKFKVFDFNPERIYSIKKEKDKLIVEKEGKKETYSFKYSDPVRKTDMKLIPRLKKIPKLALGIWESNEKFYEGNIVLY